jgi:acetaldehyde dehydrogenase/alcohol dehydrogenase
MAVEEKVVQEKHSIVEMIDILAKNAAKALAEFRCYNQEMVDEIVKQMAYSTRSSQGLGKASSGRNKKRGL